MKQILAAVIFFCLSAVFNSATAQWNAQTSGTTKDLWDVYMVTASRGWAVGYDGTILTTSNGGTSWSAQSSPVTQHLFSVFFLDENNGWIVGKAAKVLKTTNGGLNWTESNTGITGDLWDVQFLNTSVGYVASGNGMYKTVDGGSSWSRLPTSTNAFYQIFFLDENTGWCGGSSGMMRATADGGATWATQNSGTSWTIYGIHFLSATTGFAVNQNGDLLKTTNGGSTWTKGPLDTSFNYFFRVFFTSDTNGWISGMGGDIYSSTDGGQTWARAETGTVASFNSIHFSGGTGIAIGDDGTIYKYSGTDGGAGSESAPTITAFTPVYGLAGTAVTITGTNFTGSTAVKFHTTNAISFSVASATSITATVPSGAATGKISVVTPGGTAITTDDFYVSNIAPPAISSFTPVSGVTGSTVTLTGTGFNSTPSGNTVKFNGTPATVTASTTTSITTTVPVGATTGKISVTTSTGTGTSAENFTVSDGSGGGSGELALIVEIENLPGWPSDYLVKDNYLYIVGSASSNGYMSIYDITDLKNPVFKNNLAFAGKKLGVVYYDGTHLYSVGENGLFVFDLSDPINPLQLAYHDSVQDGTSQRYFRSSYGNLTKSGNLLFANGNLWRLVVADFSNIEAPVYMDGFEFNFNEVRDYDVIDENTLLLNDGAGLRIVDFTDPSNLVVMNSDDAQYMDTPAQTEQMVVTPDKQTAFTYSWGIGSSQISVVDIPSRTVLNTFDISEHSDQLYTLALNSDNTLLYAASIVNFYVFDISDKTNITYKTSNHPGEGHIRVWDDNLYLKGSSTSVVIYGIDSGNSGGAGDGLSITAFTPEEGAEGTSVTITGSGFDLTATNNIVKFNGIAATVTASTATSITSSVPADAITGPITVTLGGNTATSATDFVVPGTGNTLIISAINPSSGAVGTVVTISGAKFDAVAANNTVKFNGVTAVVASSTSSTIKTTVPAGATTGKVSVTAGGQTVTSAASFTVTTGSGAGVATPPAISAILPNSGPVGAMVIIEGSDFDPVPRNNLVKFNGQLAKVLAGTTSSLTVTVPLGATSGQVTISSPTGAASSSFTVTGTSTPVSSEPVLVKDINHTLIDESEVRQVMSYKGKTFFSANDGYEVHGEELWVTDGTETGTYLFKDIAPGSSGGFSGFKIIHKGLLYFTAYDGTHGTELWVTDGTEEGTYMVKDINSGSANSYPANFYSVGDLLFFMAEEDATGLEWWVTDGTAEGTVLLKDINPGVKDLYAEPGIAWNGKFYFYAYNETQDVQLYVSDGTAAGTVVLTPGVKYGGSVILDYDLIVYKDKLFFTYHDTSNAIELWETDGTAQGTKLFKNINVGNMSGWPTSFHIINDKLLFVSYFQDESYYNKRYLFTTDGTAAGTEKLTVLYTLGELKWTFFDGRYWLYGSDEIGGYELWQTDGTVGGTFEVKDINAGTGSSSVDNMVISGDRLYFTAVDATHGKELWVTDGSPAGTVMVKDINAGSEGSDIRLILPFDDKVYFAAQYEDGNYNLYESDGTEGGTILLLPEEAEYTTHTLPVDNYSFLFNLPGLGHNAIYVPARYTDDGVELWMIGPEISGLTSIKQEKLAGGLKVYPNPSQNTITISLSDEEQLEGLKTARLFDLPGREILTQTFRGNSQILNIQYQLPGIYLLRIFTERGELLGQVKIVKE